MCRLILLIALAVIAFLLFVIFNKDQKAPISNNPFNTENWHTYINDDHGFSVKYPRNSEVVAEERIASIQPQIDKKPIVNKEFFVQISDSPISEVLVFSETESDLSRGIVTSKEDFQTIGMHKTGFVLDRFKINNDFQVTLMATQLQYDPVVKEAYISKIGDFDEIGKANAFRIVFSQSKLGAAYATREGIEELISFTD